MGQHWHTQTQPMSYVAGSREDAALPGALSSEVDIELLASVIVPVRNGGSELAELVEALAAQTLARDRFEVIIGDDGSTDGSTRGLATPDGWARVVSGPPRNSYAARNAAVAAARSPVLAFCDADCRPEPAWLESGLAALEDAELAAGSIRFLLPRPPSIWALLDVDAFKDQERAVAAGTAETANLFVRRSLFEEAGGFDDSLPNNGDYDFVRRCVRSGARLVFAERAQMWHPTRTSGAEFLGALWRIHRANGVRQARAGLTTPFRRPGYWLPIFGAIRGRRRAGLSVGLDRRRLARSGAKPRLRDDLRALPILYVVLPYLARAARFRGWLLARRQGS